jgi:hypothetical protein
VRKLGLVVVLVAAAAAVAMLANLALLGYASSSSDPIGKLSPRAQLPAAPVGVVQPQKGPIEHDDRDD